MSKIDAAPFESPESLGDIRQARRNILAEIDAAWLESQSFLGTKPSRGALSQPPQNSGDHNEAWYEDFRHAENLGRDMIGAKLAALYAAQNAIEAGDPETVGEFSGNDYEIRKLEEAERDIAQHRTLMAQGLGLRAVNDRICKPIWKPVPRLSQADINGLVVGVSEVRSFAAPVDYQVIQGYCDQLGYFFVPICRTVLQPSGVIWATPCSDFSAEDVGLVNDLLTQA